MTALFTLLLGLAYPLAITGIAEAVFPRQAAGSLLARADGSVFGSRWIGQRFDEPRHLHGRPSAAGSDGYDASASSGSNLGPLNETLIEAVKARAAALRAEAPGATIPADAVTASASGLDPDISPEFARLQAPRIAAARGIPEAEVLAAIDRHTAGRLFGFVGQPRVNVLAVNADLDSSVAAGVATKP